MFVITNTTTRAMSATHCAITYMKRVAPLPLLLELVTATQSLYKPLTKICLSVASTPSCQQSQQPRAISAALMRYFSFVLPACIVVAIAFSLACAPIWTILHDGYLFLLGVFDTVANVQTRKCAEHLRCLIYIRKSFDLIASWSLAM